MTTINLLEKKAHENAGLKRIRGMVKSVTTVVLVIYLVVLAGFLGWEWWITNQRLVTQKNLKTVTAEVTSQSTQEVLVRKIDSRSGAITAPPRDVPSSLFTARLVIGIAR